MSLADKDFRYLGYGPDLWSDNDFDLLLRGYGGSRDDPVCLREAVSGAFLELHRGILS